MPLPARYFANDVPALVSYDDNLTFDDLFGNVYIYPAGEFIGSSARRRAGLDNHDKGRLFVHVHRGWAGYAEPIGPAAEAYRIETQLARTASFELIPWAGTDSALVVCTPSSFIGSTWVGFISVASIPTEPVVVVS